MDLGSASSSDNQDVSDDEVAMVPTVSANSSGLYFSFIKRTQAEYLPALIIKN